MAQGETQNNDELLEALGEQRQGQGVSWMAGKSTDAAGSQVNIREGGISGDFYCLLFFGVCCECVPCLDHMALVMSVRQFEWPHNEPALSYVSL